MAVWFNVRTPQVGSVSVHGANNHHIEVIVPTIRREFVASLDIA